MRLEPARRRGSKTRVLLAALFTIVLAAAVFVAALLATPWLVERAFARFADGGPDRAARAAAMRFDALTLTLELDGLELRDARAGVAVTAPSASLDFDWLGFIGFGPRTFERVAIVEPRLEALSPGQLFEIGERLLDGPLAGLRIGTLVVDAGEIALAGEGVAPFALVGIDVTATDLDASRGARDAPPGHIAARASTAAGATIELEGSVERGLGGSGRVSLRGYELASLPPWLVSPPSLAGFHARVDLDGEYVLTAPFDAARLEIDASHVELADLAITAASGLRARAERVAGDASIVVAAGSDAASVDAGSGGPRTQASARLDVAGARIEVVDAGIMPPQTFTLTDTAVSTSLAAAGGELSLTLDGRLAGAGDIVLMLTSANRNGLDVTLEAVDLPAPTLSPYAVAAIEHGLAAGTYDVALSYAQTASGVSGDLRIGAENAAFAAGALPPGPAAYALDLAIALLENVDGVVELTTPFMGGPDDDIRSLTANALEARVAALTAEPFAALAALAETDAEILRTVSFAPGATELDDEAQATIDRLAAALAQRPRLGLRVHAGADPAADRLALARRQIELHVTLATAAAGPQARPEPVDFASARAQDILDEFAGERLPAERVAAIARTFGCGQEAAACGPAYYAVIFDALAENEPIPAATVTRLGRFRAQAVAEALEQRGIAAGRVSVAGAAETNADAGGGIVLPLELFPRARARAATAASVVR